MALGGFPDWFFGVPDGPGPVPVPIGSGAVPGRFRAGFGRSDLVRPSQTASESLRTAPDRPDPSRSATVLRTPTSSGDRRRGKGRMMIVTPSDHHPLAPTMRQLDRPSIVNDQRNVLRSSLLRSDDRRTNRVMPRSSKTCRHRSMIVRKKIFVLVRQIFFGKRSSSDQRLLSIRLACAGAFLSHNAF